MEKTIKREKQDNATGTKKPYLTPSLVCYGTLKELTRGGSAGSTEGGHSKNRRAYVLLILITFLHV